MSDGWAVLGLMRLGQIPPETRVSSFGASSLLLARSPRTYLGAVNKLPVLRVVRPEV